MTNNMVAPRNILSTLKKRRKILALNAKHIYNARYKMKKADRGPRTEMQHLMKCLVEGNYLISHSVLPGTDTLSDILWAHPDSVKLFNTFPTVLVMDLTYKVNKYRIPLLEVAGCTSTGKTYAIAFGFLTSEKEDNFVWALRAVSNFLRCKDELKVIVTDRDQALMKAVDDVFPKCTALLCQYHILMNVKTNFLKKAKLGKKVRSREVWPNVKVAWENIMGSASEEEYNSSVKTFKERYGHWSEFIEYVESTILGPVKEKFVRV